MDVPRYETILDLARGVCRLVLRRQGMCGFGRSGYRFNAKAFHLVAIGSASESAILD